MAFPTKGWFCAVTSQGSLAWMTLMVVVAGAFTPGYSHVSQFISELGAREAHREWGVRFLGFLPLGLISLGFCVFAFLTLPRSRNTFLGLVGLVLFDLGYLVAAVFPCDPGCRSSEPSFSQMVHNAAGLLGYLLAPGFLLLFASAAKRWPEASHLVLGGYVASFLSLVGLLTLSESSPVAGLSQRLIEGSVLGWVALCGRYWGAKGHRDLDHPAPPTLEPVHQSVIQ